MFQYELQNNQINFNFIPTPLPQHINNMAVTAVFPVVWHFFVVSEYFVAAKAI